MSTQIAKKDLGSAVALLPKVPEFDPAATAAKLVEFGEQADRVLAATQRAIIADDESAAKGTDLLKAITQQVDVVDEYRKATTGKFDKLVKGLNSLFNKGPAFKLEQAKTIMQAKLGGYVRAQREKAQADAEAARKRAAEEAAAQAQKAVAEGDTEGALEILKEAAEVQVAPAKVEVRGNSAVLAAPRRKVGKVTDLRKFLAWAATSPSPSALAVCGGITVGQRELNQLAVKVLDINENPLAEKAVIPGFEAEYEENFGAR